MVSGVERRAGVSSTGWTHTMIVTASLGGRSFLVTKCIGSDVGPRAVAPTPPQRQAPCHNCPAVRPSILARPKIRMPWWGAFDFQ